MTLSAFLIDEIFERKLEFSLLEAMQGRSKYAELIESDTFDMHSCTVYNYARDHLEAIIKYNADRNDYFCVEVAPKESGLPPHRRYERSDPDGFEAWVHFGCPRVSLPHIQRILRECEPTSRTLVSYPPRPAYNRFFDYHGHRAVILAILEEFGPARLRDFILENEQSGLSACLYSMDNYSKSILKIAIDHLDALASTPNEQERIALPSARHFDAWIVGLCPGMRTYGDQFDACFPSKSTSVVICG